MKTSFNKLKAILLVFGVSTILIIIIFIVTIILSIKPRIRITNLSSYTSKEETRNKIKEDNIEILLFDEAKQNNSNLKETTAVVRDGTFKQYIKRNINYVEFIADIEDIKQSYKVRYAWGVNDEIKISNVDEYIICPKQNELIYGEFDCKDRFSTLYGVSDPIAERLPYHKPNDYLIKYDGKSNTIIADIYRCRTETIEVIKKEVNKWLEKYIDNLSDYEVKYNYCK
jgi:hypothetical protein